ncbi:MAG: hypothetical protein GY720_21075 [bacterium]|nr:hypothetical protein [bacterium]
MRIFVGGMALLLMVAACGESEPASNAATAAIGEQLAGRVAAPLQRAATGFDPGLDGLSNALRAALDDIALPGGVRRVVPGQRTSASADDAYAEISMSIVVITIDSESTFCMVLALSSTGEIVAEPAPGDPLDGCSDTEMISLSEP